MFEPFGPLVKIISRNLVSHADSVTFLYFCLKKLLRATL